MDDDFEDEVFLDCCNPPMVWDRVPLKPAIAMVSGISLVAMMTHPTVYIAIPAAFFAMAEVCKKDVHAFRGLFLWTKYKIVDFDWNRKFWESTSYSPLQPMRRR